MNKFIAKIFKSAGVNAKVSKSADNPKFKVVENKLTLEGIVKSNRYTMSIKDNTGRKIDSLSVIINNSNDVVNRINESINTLKMLSSAYDNQKLIEEDEEFDTVRGEDSDETEPNNLKDGLADLYDTILDVAEQAENLTAIADDNDAEQMNEIIGIASSLYDCAIDVDEFIDDIIEAEEKEMDESYHHVKESKGSVRNAINHLTIIENMLKGNKNVSDILKAVKDIKSELVVRGY
jgi:hypothetical protein